MHYLYLFIALFFSLSAFSEQDFEIIKNEATLPILNPSLSGQKTLKIRLKNGLEAILVSDPDVQQSSVAINVMAGSWQDPEAHPGIAHFLEHMLFLGTKEYPEEGGFSAYLASQGGKNNAFTHGDYTSYMFSINTEGLEEALKRFSSFFVNPLFNPSGVGRELNAINQEFAQAFNNEGMRQYLILKQLANKDHPVHRFNIGNSDSLANANTTMLRAWFNTHYSANIMRLYVLSSLPLAELQKEVVADFSRIPNYNLKPFETNQPLFTEKATGKFIRIVGQKDAYTLSFVWEIPLEYAQMIDKKPEDLICYVLGHEGKESLYHELLKEGLATQVCCDKMDVSSKQRFLELQMLLTQKGYDNPDLVIERVFQTLAGIRETPFSQTIYNEYAQLLKQRYQFKERDDPFQWAMEQGESLPLEPVTTYPEAQKTIKTFDPMVIKNLASLLSPANALIILAAPLSKQTIPLTQKEPWMNIPYEVQPLSQEQIEKLSRLQPHPNISLPAPNPYFADHLIPLKPIISRTEYPNLPNPTVILEQEGILFYYAPDPFYQVPRTMIRFLIQTPEIKDGRPQSVVLTDLYVKGLEHYFHDMLYAAQLAGLSVDFERSYGSIQVTLNGFSESVEKFIPDFITVLTRSSILQEEFEVIKEALQVEYDNFQLGMPFRQTFDYFKAAVLDKYTSNIQKSAAIKKVNFTQFQDFSKKIFQSTYLKGLILGSLSEDHAASIARQLDTTFHPSKSSRGLPYQPQVNHISDAEGPHLITVESQAQGDAVLLIIELDEFSPATRNAQEILSSPLSDAFFSQLRTKQQTGYIVKSDSLEFQRHLYNFFGAQSTTHRPQELLWRFEQFLEQFLHGIETAEIPPDRFDLLKNSIKIALKEPPATLQQYGEQLFKLAFEINDFDWFKKRLNELPKLNYEEFINFSTRYIGRENKRRFAILLNSKAPVEQAFEYRSLKRAPKGNAALR